MNTTQKLKYLLRFTLSDRRKKYGRQVDGQEIFSSNFQDLAVLNLLDQKKNGWYLEVGAQDPIKRNNTYTLEQNFNWRGVSFDIDEECIAFFNRCRRNPCIGADATTVDFQAILKRQQAPRVIDFLQIDIDPPTASLTVLQRMPFEDHVFSFIAFEHDAYQVGSDIANQQRGFLKSKGYVPLALDVTQDGKPLEDWWISPDVHERLGNAVTLPLQHIDCQTLALGFKTGLSALSALHNNTETSPASTQTR